MARMKPIDWYAVHVFRALAWFLFVAVCAQAYTIGLYLFRAGSFQSHATLGLSLVLVGLLLVLFGWLARKRSAPVRLCLIALTGLLLQPVLVYFVRSVAPVLAALHPLIGVLLALLAWRIVRCPVNVAL
jgi:hypothetical protein